MDHFLTTGGVTYRLLADSEDVDAMVEHLVQFCSTDSDPMKLLSRQMVIARSGTSSGFPKEDFVIGDPTRDGGFTRGWLEPTIAVWLDKKHAEELPADEPDITAAGQDAKDQVGEQGAQAVPAGGANQGPERTTWSQGEIVWRDVPPSAADPIVVLAHSRGMLTPAGRVLATPIPQATDIGRFVRWRWPKRIAEFPQIWLSAETLEDLGFPLEIEEDQLGEIKGLVEQHFGCTVTWHEAGWFTCAFEAATEEDDKIKAQLVLIPYLFLDPSDQRPGDMGLARIGDDATELPDDETQALHTLADRISFMSQIDEGILPSARWPGAGLRLLDKIRKRGRKLEPALVPCARPVDVPAGVVIDPVLKPFQRRPHRPKVGTIEVTVDQRRAYLASAGQVYLGYGTPELLDEPDVAELFDRPRPRFGVYQLLLPAGKELDGVSNRLPMPHGDMLWDEPTTAWITTRGIQHLMADVSIGGAGMTLAELKIPMAWVWPEDQRLLKTWTDVLRTCGKQADIDNARDRVEIIKAIYTSYIGKMEAARMPQSQILHQQWAFTPTIRADVRARAFRYAATIAADYGWYPIKADVDAWTYRIPGDADPSVLEEDSTDNGKYRIKSKLEF